MLGRPQQGQMPLVGTHGQGGLLPVAVMGSNILSALTVRQLRPAG